MIHAIRADYLHDACNSTELTSSSGTDASSPLGYQMSLHSLTLPKFVVISLRISVGLIFVLMGSWKVGSNEYSMGGRIGELFTFLATMDIWWRTIGWVQIGAGVMLITQRFATVGALILLGVAVNIALVNLALWPDFGTTMILTAYALVALTLLLWHDASRWMPLLRRDAISPARKVVPGDGTSSHSHG
jgi:uncharacterized membrane protein YphA (DoxX/SURF4 family)